jgi:hypothetical protein
MATISQSRLPFHQRGGIRAGRNSHLWKEVATDREIQHSILQLNSIQICRNVSIAMPAPNMEEKRNRISHKQAEAHVSHLQPFMSSVLLSIPDVVKDVKQSPENAKPTNHHWMSILPFLSYVEKSPEATDARRTVSH